MPSGGRQERLDVGAVIRQDRRPWHREGLKDDEGGRRVHAIIQAASPDDPPSFEEIRAWSKDRVAAYKVPKSIEVVDEIPRSAATKVNRGALLEARGG